MTKQDPSTNPPLDMPDEIVLDIAGMHCAGCALRVERALRAVPGVCAAGVDLMANRATVRLDPIQVKPETLVHVVTAAGYSARIVATEDDLGEIAGVQQAREAAAWQRRLTIGLVLVGLLVGLTYWSGLSGATLLAWQCALATPIQFYLGWPYFTGAWAQLRRKAASMDSLIALGTGTAYLAGLTGLAWQLAGPAGLAPHSLDPHTTMYFADAAMILTFITLGKYLEARAKGRASAAVAQLLDLAPPQATVLRHGMPEEVPVRNVAVGETILVRRMLVYSFLLGT